MMCTTLYNHQPAKYIRVLMCQISKGDLDRMVSQRSLKSHVFKKCCPKSGWLPKSASAPDKIRIHLMFVLLMG